MAVEITHEELVRLKDYMDRLDANERLKVKEIVDLSNLVEKAKEHPAVKESRDWQFYANLLLYQAEMAPLDAKRMDWSKVSHGNIEDNGFTTVKQERIHFLIGAVISFAALLSLVTIGAIYELLNTFGLLGAIAGIIFLGVSVLIGLSPSRIRA